MVNPRFCRLCGKEKKESDFLNSKILKNSKFFESFIDVCLDCRRDIESKIADEYRVVRKKHLTRSPKRASYLRCKWKLTIFDYEKMLKEQGGGCAICGKKDDKDFLHIDHDHKTGKIRVLLCCQCNSGLGFFKDSAEMLTKASRYLIEKV